MILTLIATLTLIDALPAGVKVSDLYAFQPAPARVVLLSDSIAPPQNSTLRAAAAPHNIFIGAAASVDELRNASDPVYTTVLAREYSLVTADNPCKWPATEPAQDTFDFTDCSAVAAATAASNGAFRGHNLCWGQYNPQWVLNMSFTPVQLLGFLTGHINTTMRYFSPSHFLCWDVVNEAISDQSNETFKPATPWYPALPNYVEQAFVAARAANSNVQLFYNDYGAEGLGTKSDKVYAMVQGFRQRGVPIDGIGMQFHISVDYYPPFADVAANMARLGALGLKVHITELDVACAPPCGSDRLALQALIYGQLLQTCLNATNVCESFETWGFTDRYTWLWDYNNPTHVDMQPLPFDSNYGKKPAYNELLAVLLAPK